MNKSLILSLCTVALLAACGGRGDDSPAPLPPPPPVTAEVPASASMSVAGLMAYLSALVASAADTLEPVDVSAVTPPVEETTEPGVVD